MEYVMVLKEKKSAPLLVSTVIEFNIGIFLFFFSLALCELYVQKREICCLLVESILDYIIID